MAWTTPPTFSAAATLTAAQMNILSDDLNFLAGPDKARAYAATTQAITTSSWTRVNLGSEDFDSNGIHSTSSNTWKMDIAVDGTYLCIGQVEWDIDTTGRRSIQIRKTDSSSDATSGSRLGAVTSLDNASGSATIPMQVSTISYLTSSDYVSLHCWHSKGSNLNINAGNDATWFSVIRLGD